MKQESDMTHNGHIKTFRDAIKINIINIIYKCVVYIFNVVVNVKKIEIRPKQESDVT